MTRIQRPDARAVEAKSGVAMGEKTFLPTLAETPDRHLAIFVQQFINCA
ncbi:hypothetical protein [Neoasaia chiangmaiensis]|nr:hypothetical protein [Neoasaia chiangmaiensis]